MTLVRQQLHALAHAARVPPSSHAGHALGASVGDVEKHHGLLRLLRAEGHVHNKVALALQLQHTRGF